MADKEEIKTLEELEEKGRILRGYKEKFRQMCQENNRNRFRWDMRDRLIPLCRRQYRSR